MKPLGFVKDHREKENNEYRDMAVLARTNAQLTILQTVMSKNMIPYDVVNGVMFTELPEIKLLISYLKLALHEGDNSAFSYVYNKPNRWLDQKFFAEVKENATRKTLRCTMQCLRLIAEIGVSKMELINYMKLLIHYRTENSSRLVR